MLSKIQQQIIEEELQLPDTDDWFERVHGTGKFINPKDGKNVS